MNVMWSELGLKWFYRHKIKNLFSINKYFMAFIPID